MGHFQGKQTFPYSQVYKNKRAPQGNKVHHRPLPYNKNYVKYLN